jgi:hypothetical protein
MTRTCSKCGAEKLLAEEFYKHPHGRDGYFGHCKACERTRSKDHGRRRREADPTYDVNVSLRRHYGITLADYDRMFAAQQGKCAICGTTKPGGRGVRFSVDHDHDTGVVRGLLCNGCNVGIGALGEDIDRLMSAAAYLLSQRDVLKEVLF